MKDAPQITDLMTVALFPLSNLVLFPRAVLPLHIFEERYKDMTADALERDHLNAMGLLKPGWEKTYYQRPPIEPVVCVGEILSHEQLADGDYNFLLRGHIRARILREIQGKPYRIVQVERLMETSVLEIDLEEERRRLVQLFTSGGISGVPAAEQFKALLSGPAPTAHLADVVAFSFLEQTELKQRLLSETDVKCRVRQIVDAVEEIGFPIDPTLN